MIIKKYNPNLEEAWNFLISNSKQGTFLLDRNFMDYHSDRFIDNSLMFYNEKEKLIALLPANIRDDILHSHQGLSYGGLIYEKETKTAEILECFSTLKTYAKENSIKKLIYKRIPYIYHNYPADEDLYALFINDAKLIRRDIGYAILSEDPIVISRSKTRYLKDVEKNYRISSTNQFESFYLILKEALSIHNALPVHSAEELKLLTERFPDNIKLYGIFNKDKALVAGTWIFLTSTTLHVQYMVATNSAKEENVIDYAYNEIFKDKEIAPLFKSKKYFSFGISTEQNGRYLNQGLAWQKESFGGRGICYDFYELDFT